MNYSFIQFPLSSTFVCSLYLNCSMKRITTLMFSLAISTASLVAQPFEGTITSTNSLMPTRYMVYTIQGDRSKQVPNGPGVAEMAIFTDLVNNRYYLSVTQQGNTAVSSYLLQGSARGSVSATPSFSNVTNTGSQQTIDGYLCDGYSGEVNGEAFSAWVAPSLATVNLKAHITPQTYEQLPYVNIPGVSGLVLEFVTSNSASGPGATYRLEVDAHTVDSAEVQAPTVNSYSE